MLEVGERVVMISGANRGLGLATAERLHGEGYRLSLGVRDPADPALDRLRGDERVLIQQYDALETAAPRRWTEATLDRFGRLDALVNNAAIATLVDIEIEPDVGEEEQEARFEEMMTVNVRAPLRLIRAGFPHLKACGAGRVVNIASLSAKRVLNTKVGYPMTKHALLAMTHAVRRAGWAHGVRATVLCPGYIRTRLAVGPAHVTGTRPEDMTTPEDLAQVVAMLLRLPNTAAIAELLLNNRMEDLF